MPAPVTEPDRSITDVRMSRSRSLSGEHLGSSLESVEYSLVHLHDMR